MAETERKITKFRLRTLWRGFRVVLYLAFAVVCVLGLARAWTAEGTIEDRRAELRRLQQLLVEQQIRGEHLGSTIAAMKLRDDVREHAIRTELGMLRENERFYVFK